MASKKEATIHGGVAAGKKELLIKMRRAGPEPWLLSTSKGNLAFLWKRTIINRLEPESYEYAPVN
jgi:hypothetical protein